MTSMIVFTRCIVILNIKDNIYHSDGYKSTKQNEKDMQAEVNSLNETNP